jgi:hypothetical protein
LRRQIDRRARQIERIAGGKAGDEFAVEQRAGERRQKRRSGGKREDVGGQEGLARAKESGR